jgi:glycerophosphoryl diester phosphodiesterase
MQVPIISHRGLCRTRPRGRRTGENTLAAFAAGLDALEALGFPASLEFDVRRSADGALVVIHDATLRRTAGVRGRVRRRSALELRDLAIPRVEEVFERFPAAEFHLEIKEREISGQVRDLIVRYRLQERVIVSSFLWKELAPLRGRIRIALTTAFPGRRAVRAAVDAGACAIHPEHRRVTAALVSAAHAEGLKVNAWTVNTPRAYARMERLWIDAVFSDNPFLLMRERSTDGQSGRRRNEHVILGGVSDIHPIPDPERWPSG